MNEWIHTKEISLQALMNSFLRYNTEYTLINNIQVEYMNGRECAMTCMVFWEYDRRQLCAQPPASQPPFPKATDRCEVGLNKVRYLFD